MNNTQPTKIDAEVNTFDDVQLSDKAVKIGHLAYVWQFGSIKRCQIIGAEEATGNPVAKVSVEVLTYDVPITVAISGDKKYFSTEEAALLARFKDILQEAL